MYLMGCVGMAEPSEKGFEMKFNLQPYDSHKSFYGKAVVLVTGNGTVYLRSYDTIVASIDSFNKVKSHWRGYSATTGRHIRAFLHHYGLPILCKKEWEKVEYAGRVSL